MKNNIESDFPPFGNPKSESASAQLGIIRLKQSDRIWKVTLKSHLKRCGAWRLQDILYTEKEPRQRFASAATLSNEILHCKRDPSRCGNAFSMRKGLVRRSCHSRHSRHPELGSGSIFQRNPSITRQGWTLNQVQGDAWCTQGDGRGRIPSRLKGEALRLLTRSYPIARNFGSASSSDL
jgi:hypothetical protein